MGTCLSTVLPRRVLGTPRKRSPKGSTPLSDDSDNKELPGEVNGIALPDSVNSNYLPDDVHSRLLSNGIHSELSPDEEHNGRVPDDVHDKTKGVETKRRALLVGITYSSPSNTWSQLDGPHGDVDQYRDVLISA
jgi:hypothetical protein